MRLSSTTFAAENGEKKRGRKKEKKVGECGGMLTEEGAVIALILRLSTKPINFSSP